jgi:hypothetical protein
MGGRTLYCGTWRAGKENGHVFWELGLIVFLILVCFCGLDFPGGWAGGSVLAIGSDD